MNAPDTIYMQDYEAFGYGIYRTKPLDDDIPYDRRKTCVWKQIGVVYIPRCPQFNSTDYPHCDEPEGDYCPYCGGRIELEEQ